MKLVFDTFKAIKFEEHQSSTLENAVSSFASNSSPFISEIETAISKMRVETRDYKSAVKIIYIN